MTGSYAYDAFGRRTAKTVGGAITRFIYDSADAVAEYDGAGALQAENWYGIGVDHNIARITGGDSFYYLHDGLNSVRQLIDDAGSVRNSYDYDAWGNLRSRVESVTNLATYTGRERDAESGLYYYRARSYDPAPGRFAQQDPVDDNSGRSPSAYVDNNPTNAIDPSGAIARWIIRIIGAAIAEEMLKPDKLNRNEEDILKDRANEQEKKEDKKKIKGLEEENRKLREQLEKQREENERLKKQKGQGQNQRGQLNVPGGGNEVASAGIDGGYGSGTSNTPIPMPSPTPFPTPFPTPSPTPFPTPSPRSFQ